MTGRFSTSEEWTVQGFSNRREGLPEPCVSMVMGDQYGGSVRLLVSVEDVQAFVEALGNAIKEARNE